jgi:glycosyltransferase involved in cell wall biosynthesis
MPFINFPHIESLSLAGYLIVGFIFLLWLFRLLYITLFYGRLAFRKPIPAGSSSLPLTILITERNEEDRLRKNLPDWLQMGYPDYELLVVDDFSEDNSPATLALLKNKFPRLKFTSLNQETRYSDKLARNLGLKAASHDLVVISHPAMISPDNHWLPGISAAFAGGRDVVVGYCNVLPDKGFRHNVYRAESFFQQMESLSGSITGLPYVTAEENVAFRKDAYFATGGLAGKIREEYLNLEMVVNGIVKRGNTAVLPAGNLSLRKDIEVDKEALRDLFNKSFRLKNHLKRGPRLWLQLSRSIGFLLLPMVIFLVLIYPWSMVYVGSLMLLQSMIYLFIINRLLNKFQESKLFVFSLMYAIVAPYYRSITYWRFIQTRKRRK